MQISKDKMAQTCRIDNVVLDEKQKPQRITLWPLFEIFQRFLF